MPEVIATIQSLESNTGEKNGRTWVRYKYTTSAGNFSTFDKKAFAELQPGKIFKLFYTEKENPRGGSPMKNLDSWEKVDAPAAPVNPNPLGIAPTQHNQDEFRRSKEEMRLLDCLQAVAGDFNRALELYGKVTVWEEERKAGKLPLIKTPEDSQGASVITIQAGVAEKPMTDTPKRGRPAKKAVEANQEASKSTGADAMPSYELLKQLNDARLADGVEKVSMLDISEILKDDYQGKNIRQLSEAEIKEVIEHVQSLVKRDTSDLPF